MEATFNNDPTGTRTSASSSHVEMDDQAICSLLMRRQKLRCQGEFKASDEIVHRLLCYENVVVRNGESLATGAAEWVRVPRNLVPDNEERRKQSQISGTCMFWKHNSRRFCTKLRAQNVYFCQEHMYRRDCRDRVPCPIDCRHSILPAKAATHIARCQSKPGHLAFTALLGDQLDEPSNDEQSTTGSEHYLVPGINTSGPKSNTTSSRSSSSSSGNLAKSAVAELATDYTFLRKLEVKVDTALDALEKGGHRLDMSLVKKARKRKRKSKGTSTAVSVKSSGKARLKKRSHAVQYDAMVNILAQRMTNFGRSPLVVVDCCAGTGDLSRKIQECYNRVRAQQATAPNSTRTVTARVTCHIVLIDRSNFKGKADTALRNNDSGNGVEWRVTRIRADLGDVDCRQIPAVASLLNSGIAGNVIVCGKHLCGAATDLALRAAGRLVTEIQSDVVQTHLCIALCCHHLCDWQTLLPASSGQLMVSE